MKTLVHHFHHVRQNLHTTHVEQSLSQRGLSVCLGTVQVPSHSLTGVWQSTRSADDVVIIMHQTGDGGPVHPGYDTF